MWAIYVGESAVACHRGAADLELTNQPPVLLYQPYYATLLTVRPTLLLRFMKAYHAATMPD